MLFLVPFIKNIKKDSTITPKLLCRIGIEIRDIKYGTLEGKIGVIICR
jgi:hypothetical protein